MYLNDVCFRRGSLAKDLPEVIGMFSKHFNEVGMKGGPNTLSLNIEHYKRLEKVGMLKSYKIIDKYELPVGYITIILFYHPHHQNTLFASADAFYIQPDYRKGLTASKFIKYIEDDLKQNTNVKYFAVNVNLNNDYSKVLEKRKFVFSEKVMLKKLGD